MSVTICEWSNERKTLSGQRNKMKNNDKSLGINESVWRKVDNTFQWWLGLYFLVKPMIGLMNVSNQVLKHCDVQSTSQLTAMVGFRIVLDNMLQPFIFFYEFNLLFIWLISCLHDTKTWQDCRNAQILDRVSIGRLRVRIRNASTVDWIPLYTNLDLVWLNSAIAANLKLISLHSFVCPCLVFRKKSLPEYRNYNRSYINIEIEISL